ncbi:MAG: response regulator [Sideroxydans sp.]|nr:response regulator [Sideroxydans sp.]
MTHKAHNESNLAGVRKTPEERLQLNLLKTGALQTAILNSANFSSIATDANGVIQIFNIGAQRMLGYAATDVINRITPAEISDPEEIITRAQTLSIELDTVIKPGFESLVFKATRGIEDIYELTYIRQDGSRFPAVVSVTALRDSQGLIIGYLLIGTDNTARKQVEAERVLLYQALQEKNSELERTMTEAKMANLAKSDFLSRMSHELRTPLNAILGFSQLLEVGPPTPTIQQTERLHQITKAGWYLLELINEILDLAVIESGKLSLSLESVLLIDVINECQAMIETQAHQHDISLNFLAFNPNMHVRADRTRLKQVLINLLSNAIKYNREQGTVEIACRIHSPNRLRISITDSGAGLSTAKQAQLFQPFNRLGQENGSEEGTGIGLVVTKQLVELMGGEIGMRSSVGVGSEFWIELNQDSASQWQPSTTTVAEQIRQSTVNGAQHTLLYVEDNPANLMLVEQIIANHSTIHMLSARDAIHGIGMARTQLPDVILMDINLPGINGFEALRLLKNDPLTARIPVVALSANAMVFDVEKGIKAGFFRYLTKPIKIDELINALEAALNINPPSLNNTPEIGEAK